MLGVRGVKGGGDLYAGVHGGAALGGPHVDPQQFWISQNSGGDYSMAMAYLLAWQGPVSEEDDPYGDSTSPDGLAPVCHVQEIRILPERNYDAVKRAVYLYGGVQTSLYLPSENRVSDEECLLQRQRRTEP